MVARLPIRELTWYQGSLLPYTSLWHIINRLGSLNCLRVSELPGQSDQPGGKTYRHYNHVIYSDERKVDINLLAAVLHEPGERMQWTRLTNLPTWLQSHIAQDLRFCRTCLTLGYHSSFYALRLLSVCPIHGESFLELMSGHWHALQYEDVANCYFRPAICRIPLVTVAQTRELDQVAAWLEAAKSIIRPATLRRSPFNTYVIHPLNLDSAFWCRVFGITYPENLAQAAHASYPVTITRGGPFRGNAFRTNGSAKPSKSKYWGEGSPASWTYRSICRRLRKLRLCDDPRLDSTSVAIRKAYYGDFQKLVLEPKFAQTFTEFLWSRYLERNSLKRRWPYRDPWADPNQKWLAALEVVGAPIWMGPSDFADGLHTWLEYHWTEYWMRCIWAREKEFTMRLASAGLPGDFTKQREPDWDWAAKMHPDGSASFACIPVVTTFFPSQRHKSKSERMQEQKEHRLHAAQAMMAACSGSCLTWSATDGWQVTKAITPQGLYMKRNALRWARKGRPKFWLYPANGNYVARLESLPLQVAEHSPKEAIYALRTAYIQYSRMYPASNASSLNS